MPTPPLPLFQSLLTKLHIPLTPPTLSSIPPTLLLLALETILNDRLSLPANLRSCTSEDDEVGMIKCLVGVLDDELGIDLSAIDPLGVIRGEDTMIGVVIMALVVIAKRRGTDISIGEERYSVIDEPAGEGWEGDGGGGLPDPLIPDLSSASDISPTSRDHLRGQACEDVFGLSGRGSSILFEANGQGQATMNGHGTGTGGEDLGARHIHLEGDAYHYTPSPEHDPLPLLPLDTYITPLPPRLREIRTVSPTTTLKNMKDTHGTKTVTPRWTTLSTETSFFMVNTVIGPGSLLRGQHPTSPAVLQAGQFYRICWRSLGLVKVHDIPA